jgi:chromosomal replication initiation ATPase DnaA
VTEFLSIQFAVWCERRGITLTVKQREAAVSVLLGMAHLGGRGSGKTFLLNTISEYLEESPPE